MSILNIFKGGSTASDDSLAGDYVSKNLNTYNGFNGSLADLKTLLSAEYDKCESYISSEAIFAGGSGHARTVCQSHIDAAFKDKMNALTAESYKQEQGISAIALAGNTKLYLTVAIIMIVIIAVVVIVE